MEGKQFFKRIKIRLLCLSAWYSIWLRNSRPYFPHFLWLQIQSSVLPVILLTRQRVHLSFSRGCIESTELRQPFHQQAVHSPLFTLRVCGKRLSSQPFSPYLNLPFFKGPLTLLVVLLPLFKSWHHRHIWPEPDVACFRKGVHILTATIWIQRCSSVDISHKSDYTLRLTFPHFHSCLRPQELSGEGILFPFIWFPHSSLFDSIPPTPFPRTHCLHPVPNPLGHSIAVIHKGFPLRQDPHCALLFLWLEKISTSGLCFLLYSFLSGGNIHISFTASSIWCIHYTLGNTWKKPAEERGTFSGTLILSEDSGNRNIWESNKAM